ncbi:MAG TPA: ATP synthase subunit I [Kofleriaceae bacterium]
MAGTSLLRIERLNYGLGAILVAGAALTQPKAIALGVAVGVALTCLNFFVLRKLVYKWTSDAAQGKTGNAPLLMLPKMVGLMGAIAVAILFLPVDPIALLIGYSLFIVSIVVDTTYSALRPAPAPTSTEHDEHHG